VPFFSRERTHRLCSPSCSNFMMMRALNLGLPSSMASCARVVRLIHFLSTPGLPNFVRGAQAISEVTENRLNLVWFGPHRALTLNPCILGAWTCILGVCFVIGCLYCLRASVLSVGLLKIRFFCPGVGAPAGRIHCQNPVFRKYKLLCPGAGAPAGGIHFQKAMF